MESPQRKGPIWRLVSHLENDVLSPAEPSGDRRPQGNTCYCMTLSLGLPYDSRSPTGPVLVGSGFIVVVVVVFNSLFGPDFITTGSRFLESCMGFGHLPPTSTSYITTAHSQNRKVNTAKGEIIPLYPSFA